MEEWYERAMVSLTSRPYYGKAVNMVRASEYSDKVFIDQCNVALDRLMGRADVDVAAKEAAKTASKMAPLPLVVVVGTGRAAQLIIRDVLLVRSLRIKVLSLGADTLHAEQVSALGASITTDLNALLTADLIIQCIPHIDSAAVEAHITNFDLQDKVVRAPHSK